MKKREGEIYDFQSYKNVKSYISTIEHIFPQNPKNKDFPENIDSLGNLISLEKRENMKLGNKMPHEKYNVYKENGRPHIVDLIRENDEKNSKTGEKNK